MKRLGYMILLLLVVQIGFTACATDETAEEGDYYLYYVNQNGDGLNKMAYTPDDDEPLAMASAMLKKLEKNTSDLERKRSIPEEAGQSNVDFNEETGVVSITFSETYKQMSTAQEVLCRSSVVLTLMQIPQVKGVEFLIGEDALTLADGTTPGVMTEQDFADTGSELLNSYVNVSVTLYYADDSGKFLRPYATTGVISEHTSIEEYVVEKLIEGPSTDGYYPTIDDDVELVSVSTTDHICYVNFSTKFLKQNLDYDPYITIYSLVNSLADVSYISKVQILIDGKSDVMYQGFLSLQEAMEKNEDIVDDINRETETEETTLLPEVMNAETEEE
jgi:germination protein M